jgi:hypothetical protein
MIMTALTDLERAVLEAALRYFDSDGPAAVLRSWEEFEAAVTALRAPQRHGKEQAGG